MPLDKWDLVDIPDQGRQAILASCPSAPGGRIALKDLLCLWLANR
jgi:hypothetical protein